MTERSVLETSVRALYLARNVNDLDTMMAQLHPDFSFRIVGNGRLGTMALAVNTPETVRSSFQALVENWDLSEMEMVGAYADGETIVVHRAGVICFIPSQTRQRTEIIDKFTFRDGRIVDLTEFVDTLFVAETIGLLDTRERDYSSSTLDRMSL
ncbi:nuclear transport factor 2 family protein [Ensifer adhaerens]|uniref:nuclear transport factor 2 family protein n=1 Tax=Ensifer adhaerens TaxID=106592 RepID=UPI0023A990FE|nr:nuclear transport factor 2 family protein [Ensifer adhaerens]WDZ78380.1 nuclear transport factor 2 family protein [Ensifer adhaerens]